MTALEKYIADQVATIIPGYEKLEFRAIVGDKAWSVEFFVTVDGVRKQCYDMAEQGEISGEQLKQVMKRIVQYIRSTSGYRKDKVNKLSVTVNPMGESIG